MRAFRLALIAVLATCSIGAAHARFLQTDPVGYEEDPNLYVYVDNDPLNHSDPTGRIVETPWDVANVLIDAASLSGNVASGNIVGALVDVAGLAYDVTATAVPGLPAGAGALIQAGRAADDVAGAVARNAGDAGEGTIVSVSRSRHPEAASHIERAQAA